MRSSWAGTCRPGTERSAGAAGRRKAHSAWSGQRLPVPRLWLQPGWVTGAPPARRAVVAGSGCGALLLYAVISCCSGIRNIIFTWVKLWSFEPQTSCMPSAGNTSTRVRSRRSSSYSVRSSPPRSGSVAVLLCCTAQHERRPPSRHVISPPTAPLGIAAETVPPRSASRQTSVTSLTGWPVTAATLW